MRREQQSRSRLLSGSAAIHIAERIGRDITEAQFLQPGRDIGATFVLGERRRGDLLDRDRGCAHRRLILQSSFSRLRARVRLPIFDPAHAASVFRSRA